MDSLAQETYQAQTPTGLLTLYATIPTAPSLRSTEKMLISSDDKNVYFTKNNIEYKIMICEQNDSNRFNRGKLLNVAFLACEKGFNFPKKYFHMNTDYTIDVTREFPKQLLELTDGFIDLYRPPFPVLGEPLVVD